MSRQFPCLLAILTFALLAQTESASAQVTAPRVLSASPNRMATLEEQLTNRLRATSEQQKAFIRFLVKQVRDGRLDAKLVVAVERKALLRNRLFPFPFFERAIRFEASKRRVMLPPVQRFATTKRVAPR
ncbi:MAG: hypothetical protein MI861_02815 [Pirellulales bacterium]|nr:hypothetical protein [Pirellulales bacterium]